LLEMGPMEQKIALQSMRMGQPLPDRIQNAPELDYGLSLYLDAFFDLDSERSHAQGVVMIPFSRIVGYADAYGFDQEQKEDLIYFIRGMDTEHCIRVAERQKQAMQKNWKD
jgi:hypothetical protein